MTEPRTLTPATLTDWVHRHKVADHMYERCHEQALATSRIEDHDERRKLREHWIGRRKFWYEKMLAIADEHWTY